MPATPQAMGDEARPADPGAVTRLPTGLCLGFGVGSLGIAILLNTVTIYFPVLMTTVLGQSAALAGMLLTVSKLYDVVADVAIGMASDRVRSRWGRRRPFMLAGALVAGLSFVLMFAPPALTGAALTLWMMAALIVYSTGYALFTVPYIAMSGEMTDGYHERTRLLSFRAFFVSLGQTFSAAGTAALVGWFGGGSTGYAWMGAVSALVLSASMIACFASTARARSVERPPSPPLPRGAAIRALGTNAPFLLLMAIKIAQYMAIAVITTTKLLFLLNVLKLGYAGMAQLTLVQNIVAAVSVPLWVALARRIGKRTAYLAASVLLMLVYASWYVAEPGLPMAEVWLRGALNGIAAAGTTLMSISMLPDVMEFDRLRTGLRREGVFSSAYTIVEKLAFALGAGLIGVLLTAAGFVPTLQGKLVEQPASAIAALYAGASIVPAALVAVSAVLMLFYRLDDRRLAALRAEEEPILG
ncbi:MFS transporter [Novosphingobium kaempferiae]|uniref:MFS transporter n=1 Tax=Novosphingobium kaempferiae TaxID=2896849 RepID=UPI001E3A11FA|nr:MFS transporter [Novosphingobium kaempferiae]